MLSVTVDTILSWNPCWLNEPDGEARVRAALAPLGDEITALGVLGLDISAEDRLWVVLREELIPARTLRLFACDCARRALERERSAGREPDPRSWTAVEVAERYARGEATEDDLAAARAAARAAAWDAAWTAERRWQTERLWGYLTAA